MHKNIKNLSIFREARIFRLKLWQTPSFLFVIMGIATIGTTYSTYIVAQRSENPMVLIVSVTSVTIIVFIIGTILVKVISKIIIINVARDDFLSLVTHQLRSPLTGTKYTFEIILAEKAGPLSYQQKELLQQGADSNNRMLFLVNDLLNISRMAEGDLSFNYEPTQIESIVKELYIELITQAQKKHITLTLRLPSQKFPLIEIDAKKIRFAIQNLIDNAIKYTPEAGTITISAEQRKSSLVIQVKDTGIGIPEKEISKLFTRFYRATNAEKTKKIGTGLGLYIAKTIIERHHGEITVKTQENKGSTFTVNLPLKQRYKL